MTRTSPLAAGLVAAWLSIGPAMAELPKPARDAFDYGDFAQAERLLEALLASETLDPETRHEALQRLGLARYFQDRTSPAEEAFLELLRHDPDHQLDAFYFPPAAVAFFDGVRERHAADLAPIRERLRAARGTDADANAPDEQPQQAEQPTSKPTTDPAPPMLPPAVPAPLQVVERTYIRTLERTTERSVPVLALMPFGLGQFQNGNRPLGALSGSLQAVAAVTSVAAFLVVEALRQPSGRFQPEVVPVAGAADAVKWWSAGAFYLLWGASAVEAAVHYVPERRVDERLSEESEPNDRIIDLAPARDAARSVDDTTSTSTTSTSTTSTSTYTDRTTPDGDAPQEP